MKTELILKPIVIFVYRHRAAFLAGLIAAFAIWFLLAYCNFNISYFGNALLWIISAPLWIKVLGWILRPRTKTDP